MNSEKKRDRSRKQVAQEKVNELLGVLEGLTLEECFWLNHALQRLYTARKHQVEKESLLLEMPEDAQLVFNILGQQDSIQSQSE